MAEPVGVDASAEGPLNLESYERWKDRARAVPQELLKQQINVDPLFAQQATRKAIPRLKALLPRLQEEFTKFKPQDIEDLHDLSCAYAHATTLVRAAEPPGSGFEALAGECSEVRAKFEAYLRAAIEGGVLSISRLDELKGGSGYRDAVHDVHLLAQIYRANWSKIEGKTYFTQADIRHADALAKRLNDALADRDTRPEALEEVSLDRQRVFALFLKLYNHLRRRVRVIVEDDGQEELLDEIMPSIYYTRSSGRKRPDEPEVVTAPGASSAGPIPPAASPSTRIGMPDSDPFLPQ